MENQPQQSAPQEKPTTPAPSHGQTSIVTWLLITAAIIVIVVLLFGGGGYGDTKTKDFTVESFTTAHMAAGVGTLVITQGEENALSISAPEKYLEWITVDTDEEALTVDSDRPWYQQLFFVGPKKDTVTYTLTVTNLQELSVDGAMDINTNETFAGDTLDIQINGAGDIDMALDLDTFSLNISGAGSAELSGRADAQELSIDGAGDINARELIGTDVSVEINGAGSAEVYSSGTLKAEVNGAGSISYAGNPTDVDQQVNGVGSIKNLETGDEMTDDEADMDDTNEESIEAVDDQNETTDESMEETSNQNDSTNESMQEANTNENAESDNVLDEILEDTTNDT